MLRKLPLLRLCSLTALSLAAMAVSAPSALAGCSCMCVDGTPYNVCTGFVNSQEQTPECDALQCPAVDPATDPVDDPVTDTEPVPPDEEPVATIDPPHPGLVCERRSVYRPDLGHYKKYKVCKPADRHGHDRRAHEHNGKYRDSWAKVDANRKARWEAQKARYEAGQEHHHDHDHD